MGNRTAECVQMPLIQLENCSLAAQTESHTLTSLIRYRHFFTGTPGPIAFCLLLNHSNSETLFCRETINSLRYIDLFPVICSTDLLTLEGTPPPYPQNKGKKSRTNAVLNRSASIPQLNMPGKASRNPKRMPMVLGKLTSSLCMSLLDSLSKSFF